MKVAALYISPFPYDSNSGEHPPEIECRIHNSEKALGILPAGADSLEPTPKIIFWVANLEAEGVTLTKNAVVSVEAGEAYRIALIHPTDRETITCDVTKLDEEDTAYLPVPE